MRFIQRFINSAFGLSIVLMLFIFATGLESKLMEDFDDQVGDKAADFFKQEFGQAPEHKDDDLRRSEEQ